MHLAVVDSNPVALELLQCAKQEGHRVSYLPPAEPAYPLTAEQRRFIGYADWVSDGIATTEPAAVTAALARLHAAHPVDFATSHLELAVEAVAVACKTLGIPGTSPDAVLLARRKDRTRAALLDAGLATTAFALADDADQAVAAAAAIGYPVVVKPPSGAGSKLAFVARDEAALRGACQRAAEDLDHVPATWRDQLSRGFLVEERLSGPLVSAEIGLRGGRSHLFCVSGRTRAAEDEVIETGVHIPAELPPDQLRACGEYAATVCRLIGLDRGVFHIEMIVTGRGPVLVEANPRIMGGFLPTVYRLAAGASIYRSFLQVVSGAPVTGGPAAFDGCVAGRRLFPRVHGTMPDRWDPAEWLGGHRPAVLRVDGPEELGIRPRQPVRPGQLIGRVILRGADYAATARAARDILGRAERALGVELMAGEYDP
jgi:biotin carboxylase